MRNTLRAPKHPQYTIRAVSLLDFFTILIKNADPSSLQRDQLRLGNTVQKRAPGVYSENIQNGGQTMGTAPV